MEYFDVLIKYPSIFVVLFIIAIVKFKDNLLSILPTNKKKLEKLLKSKEIYDNYDKNSPILDEFLIQEIKKRNFYNVTGLKNKNFLIIYNSLNKDITWEEFKKIYDRIPISTELDDIKSIPKIDYLKAKIEYIYHAIRAIFFLSISLILLYKIYISNYPNGLVMIDKSIIPVFAFIYAFYLFMIYMNKITIVKRYNEGVEKLLSKKVSENKIL